MAKAARHETERRSTQRDRITRARKSLDSQRSQRAFVAHWRQGGAETGEEDL